MRHPGADRRVPAGGDAELGHLRYQAYTDRYYYPWKTTRALVNTCREFSISFTDGTTRSAYLQFVL